MLYNLGNILKDMTNFEIHQNLFKYWFALLHFAMDYPVAPNFNEGSLMHWVGGLWALTQDPLIRHHRTLTLVGFWRTAFYFLMAFEFWRIFVNLIWDIWKFHIHLKILHMCDNLQISIRRAKTVFKKKEHFQKRYKDAIIFTTNSIWNQVGV